MSEKKERTINKEIKKQVNMEGKRKKDERKERIKQLNELTN